jgi:hypothetical protein
MPFCPLLFPGHPRHIIIHLVHLFSSQPHHPVPACPHHLRTPDDAPDACARACCNYDPRPHVRVSVTTKGTRPGAVASSGLCSQHSPPGNSRCSGEVWRTRDAVRVRPTEGRRWRCTAKLHLRVVACRVFLHGAPMLRSAHVGPPPPHGSPSLLRAELCTCSRSHKPPSVRHIEQRRRFTGPGQRVRGRGAAAAARRQASDEVGALKRQRSAGHASSSSAGFLSALADFCSAPAGGCAAWLKGLWLWRSGSGLPGAGRGRSLCQGKGFATAVHFAMRCEGAAI